MWAGSDTSWWCLRGQNHQTSSPQVRGVGCRQRLPSVVLRRQKCRPPGVRRGVSCSQGVNCKPELGGCNACRTRRRPGVSHTNIHVRNRAAQSPPCRPVWRRRRWRVLSILHHLRDGDRHQEGDRPGGQGEAAPSRGSLSNRWWQREQAAQRPPWLAFLWFSSVTSPGVSRSRNMTSDCGAFCTQR